MNLKQATAALMDRRDIAAMLTLADSYIQAQRAVGSRLVIPDEHEFLRPIVKAFASDGEGFVGFLRSVMQDLQGKQRYDVYVVYRKIGIRIIQRPRRARARKSLKLMLPEIERRVGRSLAFHEKLHVVSTFEACWATMRLEYLSDCRGTGPATREEHATNSTDFFVELDRSIDQGNVPLTPGLIDKLVKELKK